jgi:hypothetical protein
VARGLDGDTSTTRRTTMSGESHNTNIVAPVVGQMDNSTFDSADVECGVNVAAQEDSGWLHGTTVRRPAASVEPGGNEHHFPC